MVNNQASLDRVFGALGSPVRRAILVRLEAEVNRSTRFTVDVSHDLRSSMTVILANTELALRRTRPPESYRATLQTIQQESNHILAMLEDMLLAARAAGATQTIDKLPVDFAELITEVFLASGAAASIKQQTLILEQSEPKQLWVLGDRSLLRRMLSSLIDNAIKYTPSGGFIELSHRMHAESFTFEVRDNGIGISPDLQDRVFDRLFRADAARSRRDLAGSGLGLSIVKWIAEIHGFQVDLCSKLEHGSTFTIEIPDARLIADNSKASSSAIEHKLGIR